MRIVIVFLALLTVCFLQTFALKLPSVFAANVNYHVWYHPEPADANAEPTPKNITIAASEVDATVGHVMERAKLSNEIYYDFEFIEYPFGRYVTTIGGFEEDPSKDIYWMLYLVKDGAVDVNSPPSDEQLTDFGIDGQLVKDGETYLFWRKVYVYEPPAPNAN